MGRNSNQSSVASAFSPGSEIKPSTNHYMCLYSLRSDCSIKYLFLKPKGSNVQRTKVKWKSSRNLPEYEQQSIFGIFMAHAKNGFCMGLLFFLNSESNTEITVFADISLRHFLTLEKKCSFLSIVVSDYPQITTLLMTLACIQNRPIIVIERNVKTRLKWNPNKGTGRDLSVNFFPSLEWNRHYQHHM